MGYNFTGKIWASHKKSVNRNQMREGVRMFTYIYKTIAFYFFFVKIHSPLTPKLQNFSKNGFAL